MDERGWRSTRQRPANSSSSTIKRHSSSSRGRDRGKNLGVREWEHGHAAQLLCSHRKHAHTVKVCIFQLWV